MSFWCRCLILLCLSATRGHAAVQTCMDKHQVVGVLRQMDKFLKGQEIRFTEGLRIMKSKLATLQNSVSKLPQADQSAAPTTCPQLEEPDHGIKFGSKHLVGHEVHFTCSQGYHLVGSATRVCQDNGTWSGPGVFCKDVNECEVYRLDQGGTLCVHECVNVPGSYHCSCPSGYKLLPDGRSCEDVDECLNQQHNCSRGTTCINTGGGFQCVNPDCPRSHGNITYVKTSSFQCERNPCPMDSRSCNLAPKTVSFHFLSLPSNLQTPATLFRMATAGAPGRAGPDSLRFGIVGGNSRGTFVMQRSDRQTGELILVQQLRGPQEISVDVDMSEYADRTFQAKHVARVHILVSPYNF
ncbi:fibulin-7 isoform X2 [Nerophis lumbriciformis]|uniref:fibulin-7 isoform X2 n=1 Tax=Nerophis lumbriciformis TaxID=546530 RepID=UPI002AE086AB|nr:fibulin-7 isoform X2 [Nerophis lumbriciformis]